jgi:hypothetical protein
MKFIKSCITKIWEGFLQNIGVLITAFVLSGGYLVAINKLNEFRSTIRSIPSDYFLTPLVLLLILFGVVLRINRSQEKQLSQLKLGPKKNQKSARLASHLGVWWKIYDEDEYIEDFPYCSCCEPNLKLVQIDWHPDELFKCSKTGTEYKLYDGVPRDRINTLESLYKAYFQGFSAQLTKAYYSEVHRIKELNPDMPEAEITKKAFEKNPFSRIPPNERDEIIQKHSNPSQAFRFVERHIDSYKKYFKQEPREKLAE